MTTAEALGRIDRHRRGPRATRLSSDAAKKLLTTWIVGGLAVLVFCLRPSAIGEANSFLVSILMSILVGAYLLMNGSRLAFRPPVTASTQLLLLMVVLVQVTLQASAAGGVFAVDAPKGLAMSLISTLALLIAVSSPRNARIFFSSLCVIVLIVCASTVVTAVLMAIGVRWTSLVIGHNNQTAYGNLSILFPYTLSYNLAPTPFGIVPRLSGLFREPGILPPFACWAAAYAHLRKWPLIFSLTALAASVASLSTLGVPLAAYTGSLILLRRMGLRTWPALGIVTAAALAAWPIIYGLEYVGLGAKIRSQTGSFEARRDAIATALSASNMVFGDGPSLNYLRDATVNLIGRIRSIGVFGFGILLTAHVLPWRTSIFVIGASTLVMTCLITQPIAGDAAVIAVCLSWTAFERR